MVNLSNQGLRAILRQATHDIISFIELVTLNGVKGLKFADRTISMRQMLHSVQHNRTYRSRHYDFVIAPSEARDFKAQDDKPIFRLPFTFRLLPLTFLLLSAFCLTSCSLNPDMQGHGQASLQGEWQQDTSAIQQKLVTSSSYRMRFDCDSFFVQINSISKVNYGADTCMRSGHWSEYIKGNYAQKNDTLYLKGLFCNPDFSFKENTDCFRTGPYKEFFKIVYQKDSLIQLSGTSSVIPIQLHLIKRTTCTPKPL